MTPEEIQEFMLADDIVLEDTNSAQSYKTNFLIITRNFKKFKARLKVFHSFMVHVYNMIDVDSITDNVIENLTVNKPTVTVPNNLPLNNSIIDGLYKITRLPNNVIHIEKQLNPETWIVDNLLVTVKNVDGQILYPVIITNNNIIEIHFIDGISSNYKVIFI